MMGNSGIEEPQAADSTVVRALQLNVPLGEGPEVGGDIRVAFHIRVSLGCGSF